MKNAVTALLLSILSTSILAEEIKLTGYDSLQAKQKATCGTIEEGKARYAVWEGRGYSRVPGEKDRVLFNVLGINTRHCSVVEDKVRGKGFRSVSREIMVYMDQETGEVIDTWTNPWTGKEIEVLHVANDPVNMRAYTYERDEQGNPSKEWSVKRYGDFIATSNEAPLFYDNPLGGDYQAYVGGTYHAMEIFNTFYNAEKFLDVKTKSVGDTVLGWSRVAQWLPWLEMGSRPGLMIFNTSGFSTFDKGRIPKKLMSIIEERYPLYLTPPPLLDKRPNETSWTVFQKHMEKKK